jgi:hypothetical protein
MKTSNTKPCRMCGSDMTRRRSAVRGSEEGWWICTFCNRVLMDQSCKTCESQAEGKHGYCSECFDAHVIRG